MKTRLGRQESQLLAYSQMRGVRTVRTGELIKPLRLSADQERELFRRMNRDRLIARVRPGLYLVPPRLPLGLQWVPSSAEVLNTLMDDCSGTYQLCGPNAFNRYGFDDQVPNRLYLYNDRISGNRQIGNVELTLVKVNKQRLGATDVQETPDGQVLVYSSRARALIDAVYDWSRFNTIPRCYQWIRDEVNAKRVKPAELVKLAILYGDIGTRRRIGALLEQIGSGKAALRELEKFVSDTTSPIPFVPGLPKRGAVNVRWGVVLNECSEND